MFQAKRLEWLGVNVETAELEQVEHERQEKAKARSKRAYTNRKKRDSMLRSLGLTPVKVNGETIWE